MEVVLTINGKTTRADVRPSETLLDLLRRLGYTSVKYGCGEGFCGACTVILDGLPVNSCLVPAVTAGGRDVTTVERLGTPQTPHPLQEAFVEAGAVQCGFCTPGMILAAKALLDRKPDPTEEEIKEALDGNLCRCTGYVQIVEGVRLAAQRMKKAKGETKRGIKTGTRRKKTRARK